MPLRYFYKCLYGLFTFFSFKADSRPSPLSCPSSQEAHLHLLAFCKQSNRVSICSNLLSTLYNSINITAHSSASRVPGSISCTIDRLLTLYEYETCLPLVDYLLPPEVTGPADLHLPSGHLLRLKKLQRYTYTDNNYSLTNGNGRQTQSRLCGDPVISTSSYIVISGSTAVH